MVHQHQIDSESTSVPEELYNLTQLANVTLAAGKLYTANSSSIISHSESIYSSEFKSHQPALTNKNLVYYSLQPPQQPTNYNRDNTELYRKLSIESANNYITKNTSSASDEDQHSDTTTLPAKIYAHKIFDKRKARKLSYQSDDSADFEAQRMGRYLETQTATANQTKDYNLLSMNDGFLMSGDEVADDGTDFGEILSGVDGDEGDIHNCPECGKKYSTSSNLARHRQTHRSLMDKKARRCPHCDKVYVSMPAFSMHVRTHNQGCECPHCGKRFSRPWLLQGHIRTHTGEKPFECSICAKAFADKSNLRAHIQTHSNTKPHACARCGKSFALKSYLYKHEESSCIRSQGGKHTGDRDQKLSKTMRSNSTYSSTSSNSSQTSSHKIAKQRGGKTANANDTHKRFKEKLRNKLRAAKELAEESNIESSPMEVTRPVKQHGDLPYQSNIVMDSGSQKSYIQLMKPVEETTPNLNTTTNLSTTSISDYHQQMPYSRCSVIRTAITTSSNDNNRPNGSNVDMDYTADGIGFYEQQETPVDFSPKNKFAQTSGNPGNGFEMVRRSYMMVA